MNEIEEKFYKTFWIEPYKSCIECGERDIDCLKGEITRKNCNSESAYIFFEITDRILLELICMFNKYHITEAGDYWNALISTDIETLKYEILNLAIENCTIENFKNSVQSLFTEGEE